MLKVRINVLFLLILFYYLVASDADNPITSVVRKTLEATARGCMSHVNATEADLEYLKEDPPFPEKAACVTKCLLEKIGIIKQNRYSKHGFLAVITPLVMRNKKKLEHMKAVSENCDEEVNQKETLTCQLGNEVTVCIFKYAPELHFNKKAV